MNKGFLKEEFFLDERSDVTDLFGWDEYTDNLLNKIESSRGTKVMGLVGKYGVGKSTLLYQVRNKIPSNYKWIKFDSWKYPDRKELWEGFILEFAEQLGNLTKGAIERRVEGKNTLLHTGKSILESLTPIKFSFLNENDPLKRTYQYINLLDELIENIDQDIIIEIEDLDRSGPSGIYFLETLHEFIHNCNPRKKIIVIVTIGEKNYEEQVQSYLKCIDIFETFTPKLLNATQLVRDYFAFDNIVQDKSKIEYYIFFISNYFTQILEQHKNDITIRVLKTIIRKSNISFMSMISNGLTPDLGVLLVIETMKFIKLQPFKNKLEGLKLDKFLNEDSAFTRFLYIISHGYRPLQFSKGDLKPFKFASNSSGRFMKPELGLFNNNETDEEEEIFLINDIYLDN